MLSTLTICWCSSQAIGAIGGVCSHINEEARFDQERKQVVSIHARFKQPKAANRRAQAALADLVQPGRRFLREATVQAAEHTHAGSGGVAQVEETKRRRLLLFSDLLMLVKDKGEDKLSYKAHIHFTDAVQLDTEQRPPGCLAIEGMALHSDDALYRGGLAQAERRKWELRWETPAAMAEWQVRATDSVSASLRRTVVDLVQHGTCMCV